MSELTDTEIPWVGDIPRDWEMFPLFSIASENKKKNKEENDNVLSLSYGRIIRRDLSKNFGLLPENFDGYQVVDDGYIIIRSTDLQNDKKSLRVGLVNEYGVITSAYIGLSPSDNMYPKYLFYYLNMCDLKKVFYSLGGGLRQSLRFDEFRRFPTVVPPIEEQKLISRYLDKKTDQIDRLVEKIKKKIELLKEQRTSLINQCVTKGLDPNVEMKDSGVEWIGDIPKHWDVKKIKHLSMVKRGSSPRPIDDPRYFDDNGDYAWVRIADVSASDKCLEKTKEKLSELGSSLSTKMEPGDIFLSIAGTVGKPMITHIKCCIHDGFVWFEDLRVDVDFLFYVFLQGTCFQGLGKLGTQLNLNTDTVGDVYLPIPDQDEQSRIVEKIKNKHTQVQKYLDLEILRLNRLQEYRQSLISSVVTGKVRVTEDMI